MKNKLKIECKLAELSPYFNNEEGIKLYCKDLGINKQTYDRYCSNKSAPRLQRALYIASIIGVNVTEIWSIKEE